MRMLRAIIVSLALTLFLAAGCGVGEADKDAGVAGPNASVRSGEATRERSTDDRPNIVFVMTDDMEERMLSRMPAVRSRMMGEGVTFKNAFVTQSLCCPSRATILRGQYPHNHRILGNSPPLGGEPKFRDLGLDKSTIATWLDGDE